MSGASTRRRLVLTRDPAAAGRLEAQLGEAGIEFAHLPLTEQRAFDDDADLRCAVTMLHRGHYEALVLTSANTVRALGRAGFGRDSEHPAAPARIVVTGAGTAHALHQLTGITEIWHPAGEASAVGILRELPAPRGTSRLLLPQSAQARSELHTGLTERGWQVDHISAYCTVPLYGPEAPGPRPRQRLLPDEGVAMEPGEITAEDVVLITSSSAAQVWAQLRGIRPRPYRVLAIGAPTAATLQALGEPVDAVLPTPTAQGVQTALSC